MILTQSDLILIRKLKEDTEIKQLVIKLYDMLNSGEGKAERCEYCTYWTDKKGPYSDGMWGKCLAMSHDGHKPLVDNGGGAIAWGIYSQQPNHVTTREDFYCKQFRRN